MFTDTSIGNNENEQLFTQLTLMDGNLADGNNEILNIDGSPVAITNGNTGTTALATLLVL